MPSGCAYGNARASLRQSLILAIRGAGRLPTVRRMSACKTVSRCSHFTAEVWSRPDCLPSGVLTSIKSCVQLPQRPHARPYIGRGGET